MAILQFHDEMDEDVHRHKASSSYQINSLPKPSTSKFDSHRDLTDSELGVRRPLNTVSLLPPDYHVDAHRLLQGYIEKEVKFGGILKQVEIDVDITNRIQLLRLLDKAKRESLIPWKLSSDDDAIFSISCQNIKLSHRDGKEELILRLAIHEIIELSYIRDDDSHLVIVKFGNPQESTDMCQIAVLYCDNQTSAEEACSLVNQCFQLVYTEATMQYLDEELREAATGLSLSSTTTVRTTRSGGSSQHSRSDVSRGSVSQNSNASTPNWRRLDPTKPSFLSQSQYDLEDDVNNIPPPGTLSSTSYSVGSRSLPRLPNYSPAVSEGDISPAAKEVLSEYMKELQTKLTKPELKKFAMLIKAWREEKMPFYIFCDKVLDLYGPERKYLLPGMRPFLGEREEESIYFESFLERVGAVKGLAEAAQVLGSRHSLVVGPSLHHSLDVAATLTGGDEFDRRMADIQQHIVSMESTVEMTTSLDHFLPKS